MTSKLLLALSFLWVGNVSHAQVDWIPPQCTVETWCLKSATDCFIAFVSNPHGLYQAQAQYSLVRVATVLCPTYPYGNLERRVITGPVEPSTFRSAEQSQEWEARTQALNMCEAYRTDYVAASPKCPK